jgi:hypothetical protein
MSTKPCYVKMSVLDEGLLVEESVWNAIEKRLGTNLQPYERALWARLNGGRTPRDSIIISGRDRSMEIGQPDFFSMQFHSLDPKAPPNHSVLGQRLRYDHFDVSKWLPIGNSDGIDLLWSIEKRAFATIHVHEHRNMPVLTNASFRDFVDNVYIDLAECGYLENLSERQCALFFRESMTDDIKRYLHLACQDKGESEISAAIFLELPKRKLSEVFSLYRSKINNPDRDTGKYPIHIAANAGRVDALMLLVEHGAMMDVGDESPFYTALNCGSLSFLRSMVRLGGKPTRSVDIKATDRLLGPEERRFVFE